MFRPSYAEIDLGKLRANLRNLRKKLPRGVEVLAVVKADAYGHGAKKISAALEEEGVRWFGVASLEEAVELREAGVRGEILIFGFTPPHGYPLVAKERLIQTVFARWMVKELYYAALHSSTPINVMLQVDLGMNRLGLKEEEFSRTVEEVLFYGNLLKLRGVFTHFPLAGEDHDYTLQQVKRFARLVAPLKKSSPSLFVHAGNSAAVLSEYPYFFDGVRLGISLYGLPPLPHLTAVNVEENGERKKYPLQPVMSLKSRVISLKWVKEGEGVSYSHTFKAQRPTLIATVPVGYADGYPRSLSNRGEALFRGRRVRVIGNVTMDYLLLDLTEFPDAGIGEEIVLFGESEGVSLSAAELAEKVGTIPYEITCMVGKRIRREYIER